MELHIEKMKVPPLAPPAQPGPATAAWVAFEAPTAAGSLRLWAYGAVRHAADAAVLLEGCAPLLDALDGWLDFAPAWRWCPQGATVATPVPHGRAQWRPATGGPAGAPAACRIEWPWAMLRDLTPAPTPLAEQLVWTMAPAVLVLAQMHLDDSELAALEPGGALLLPASMGPGWQGWLRAADEPARPGAGLPVALPTPWTPQPLAHASAGVGGDGGVELRLGLPRPVDARALAGWQPCEPIDDHARASLWRCAGETGPAQYLASGSLLPWGDGWAFLAESIEGG